MQNTILSCNAMSRGIGGGMSERIRDTKSGFTLPELLIVVAIIAVLVAIAISVFNSQLESSRRAVDMANARNICASLLVGMNTDDIEFEGDTVSGSANPACIAVVVGPSGEAAFVSGNVKIKGQAWDTGTGHGHERVKSYLEESGCGDFTLASKASNNGGWGFYTMFLYSDGSSRMGSGTADDSGDYRDDTFENHAAYWKSAGASNIEKAMGIGL